jgi:hypothetical protein
MLGTCIASRRQAAAVCLALLASLALGGTAVGQCSTCGAGGPSLFQLSQADWNPSTLGITAGVEAPTVQGITYAGLRTILVVGAVPVFSIYLPVLERWALRGDVQVVVACPGSAQMAASRGILAINPLFALNAAADFRIGSSQGFVTYFIDEKGAILYRHTRYNTRDGATLDALAEYFASTGTVPAGTLNEQVLWYGDTAVYPDFPLEGMQGEEVWVRPGRPLVVLSCYCAIDGQPAVVQESVADLPAEYPEVDFLWIYPYVPWEAYADDFLYVQLAGLDGAPPVSLGEYLAEAEPTYRMEDAYVRQCMSSRASWRVALDPGYKLSFYWLLQGSPMIMILDSSGDVLFPPTFFVIDQGSGTVDATAVDELRGVLNEIVGR